MLRKAVNLPLVCLPSSSTTIAWPNARSVRPSFVRIKRELSSSEIAGSVSILGGHIEGAVSELKLVYTKSTLHETDMTCALSIKNIRCLVVPCY